MQLSTTIAGVAEPSFVVHVVCQTVKQSNIEKQGQQRLAPKHRIEPPSQTPSQTPSQATSTIVVVPSRLAMVGSGLPLLALNEGA
jgi:hypothetical protein